MTYYTALEPDLDPTAGEDLLNYGPTIEAAEKELAEYKARAITEDDHPEYWDSLKLYRVTIEEVERKPIL